MSSINSDSFATSGDEISLFNAIRKSSKYNTSCTKNSDSKLIHHRNESKQIAAKMDKKHSYHGAGKVGRRDVAMYM